MLIGFDASRAFVSDSTGTENYSLNLLKALMRLDKKNNYTVYLRGNLDPYKKIRKIPKNFSFKVVKPTRLWTQLGLALETWRSPVDVLFVPAHTLPILRRGTTKCVVTIHDLGVEYLPNYHKFPQRYYLDFASKYAARHADALIAVSETTKRDLINRYHVVGKKVRVIPEGVDRSFFKAQPKVKVESAKRKYKVQGDYIFFVGTIQPRKNLEFLIEAYSKAVYLSNDTDFPILVIAGKLGWDYKGILEAPGKHKVGKKVKFIGRVDDSDLPALYSGAKSFVFPSLFEGFGLPILEALSCGCPVLASDIGPHKEILNSRGNFVRMILAKPDDMEQWVRFLYQTITKYEKRLTIVSKNEVFFRFYSWERAAKQCLKLFEGVLG